LERWEDWQLEVLDNYLKGIENFENQQELADYIGKELNAVKIKLSRKKKELEGDIRRKITKNEYIIILSNRFSKNTKEISEIIKLPESYIIDELDELDSLECMEFLLINFVNRDLTKDEYDIFKRLYKRGYHKNRISHILNRNINFIEELINSLC
jgi:hypothetical protein